MSPFGHVTFSNDVSTWFWGCCIWPSWVETILNPSINQSNDLKSLINHVPLSAYAFAPYSSTFIRMAFEWINMSAKHVLQHEHAHSIPYWVCPPSSSLDMAFLSLIWHDFSMAHLTRPLSNSIDVHHFGHTVYMPFQSHKNFCISKFTEHCMPYQSLNGQALSVIIGHHSMNTPFRLFIDWTWLIGQ